MSYGGEEMLASSGGHSRPRSDNGDSAKIGHDHEDADLTNNNQRDGLIRPSYHQQEHQQEEHQDPSYVKKEDHLFSSSCLYTESLAAAAAAVAAAAAAGVKQEEHALSGSAASHSYVKLEPEQPHDVHLYHSALYAEPSARTCWTSTAAAAAAVAASPVYAGSGTAQHHHHHHHQTGYVDFGRPELDHYSALQKLSCSFPPPPPPPPPPTDCGSNSSHRTGSTSQQQQQQQGSCLQQTATSNSTSSSGYRMMNPSAAAAAAAAAVAAMSTPLYAMSSLGYSEWSTGASSVASSGVGSGTNSGRTGNSSSAPLSKGECVLCAGLPAKSSALPGESRVDGIDFIEG